jgi:hypothetical protein
MIKQLAKKRGCAPKDLLPPSANIIAKVNKWSERDPYYLSSKPYREANSSDDDLKLY